MCDCVQSYINIAYGGAKSRKLGLSPSNYSNPLSGVVRDCIARKLNSVNVICVRVLTKKDKPLMKNHHIHRVCTNVGVFGSNEAGHDEQFEVGLQNGERKLRDSIRKSEVDDMGSIDIKTLKREKQHDNGFGMLNSEVLQEKGENLKEEGKEGLKGGDLIGIGNEKSKGWKEELLLQPKGKQLIKRSSLLAKQVIGIQSALSFGFVSQLWIDTSTWVVLEVEVRPSLLSSESGKFLLKDIKKVGDVVLVQDESVMLNEFRTVGLETLVGYNVVTPRQRNLGKVRGYTFNINSGAVHSLELDAFGFSIIPSSLVTTYALFTEDVVAVVSDTIVVHEEAASRIQRLTKGLLGMKNMESSSNDLKYRDLEEEYTRPAKRGKSRKKSSKRRFYPGTRDLDEDLELPMDYM